MELQESDMTEGLTFSLFFIRWFVFNLILKPRLITDYCSQPWSLSCGALSSAHNIYLLAALVFVAAHGLSLVVSGATLSRGAQTSQCSGFSCFGARVLERRLVSCGKWALRYMGSSLICIPCIGRWILYHWTTREIPALNLDIKVTMGPSRRCCEWLRELASLLLKALRADIWGHGHHRQETEEQAEWSKQLRLQMRPAGV